MASKDTNGDPLPVYDGSTWDPFAGRLLLTTEEQLGAERLSGDAALPVAGGAA